MLLTTSQQCTASTQMRFLQKMISSVKDRPGWRRMWRSTTTRPRHPRQGAAARLADKVGGSSRWEKNGRRRRHWVGGFTFIPFSSPTRCLPNTESPQDGLTGGSAAIDLPLIMGVTQEATCLQKKRACMQQAHLNLRVVADYNLLVDEAVTEKLDPILRTW